MNWRVLLVGLTLVLPLVWVLGSGFGKDPSYIPSPLIGKPAPRFDLPVLSGAGQTVNLADHLGKPVVVNFWATWCETCGVEHPTLLKLARTYEGRVQFLGIAYLETEPKLKAWLDRHGGSAYPTLVDVGSMAAVAYGVGRLPETYLIDKAGMIQKKYFGAIDAREVARDLQDLL